MNNNNKSRNSIVHVLLWPFRSYLRILIVVSVIGLYQYQSIQIDILARDIRSLELKRNQLINKKATLQVQIDQLTHINRIEKLARENHGLVASGRDIGQLVIKKYDAEAKFSDKINQEKIKLAGIH
jgi:cell division protein FtsB